MRRHLIALTLVALPLATALTVAQTPPPASESGLQLSAMDRSADPCTDFFQFANGAWRARNPIPATKSRWSRRWQAEEATQVQLRDILEQVSARRDWPDASIEQQLGDLYAACMDETRVDALDISPLQPVLAQIAAIRDRSDLERAIARLHELGIGGPFAVVAAPDPHAPTRVTAWFVAGDLGLPDRSYYLDSAPLLT